MCRAFYCIFSNTKNIYLKNHKKLVFVDIPPIFLIFFENNRFPFNFVSNIFIRNVILLYN